MNKAHRYIAAFGTDEMREVLETQEFLGKDCHVVYHEEAEDVIVSIEYEVSHPSGTMTFEYFNEAASEEAGEVQANTFAAQTGRFW